MAASASSAVHQGIDLVERGTVQSRKAWLPVLLVVLLLGVQLGVRFGKVSVDLWPMYLLPLFAAWWAREYGLAVVIPLALLTLVPDMSWRLVDGLALSYGFSESVCVLSIGMAIAYAPAGATTRAAPSARPGWRIVGLAGLGLWVLAATENARSTMLGTSVGAGVDPFALIAVLLVLLVLDTRRIATALGYSNATIVGLVVVVLAGLVAYVSLRAGSVGLRLGSASAATLVPAAVFVAVTCGWTTWRRALLLLGALALLSQLAQFTVGPMAEWMFGLRSSPMPWALFVNGGIAAMLATVFARERVPVYVAGEPDHRGAGSIEPQPALAVSLAMVGIFVVLPAVRMGSVDTWGTTFVALAGISFLAGRHFGKRGALGAPAALLFALSAAGVSYNAALNLYNLTSSFPTLAGVTLVYGLAGWLAHRRLNLAVRASLGSGEAPVIDISPLARVVQQVDQASTLRAFFALLAPAFVLWQLAGVGGIAGFAFDIFDRNDAPALLAIVLAGTFFALWPLAFVLLDWIDRQDSFRMVSAATGGALAWLGAAVLALAVLGPLAPALGDAPVWTRFAAVAVLAASALAVSLAMFGTSLRARRAAMALAAVPVLAVVSVLAWIAPELAEARADDEEGTLWLQLGAAAIVVVMLAFAWARAVRLRMVLAEDHPRSLLYGALPPGRFWVRMGALLGLPSSMWARKALARPAAWCTLLARPVVYAGAAWLKTSVPGGLVVLAAGHALFALGKRLAAMQPWRPHAESDDPRAPVLFLRASRTTSLISCARPGSFGCGGTTSGRSAAMSTKRWSTR